MGERVGESEADTTNAARAAAPSSFEEGEDNVHFDTIE